MVDAAEGVLGIEWIDGKSVRFLLGGGEEHEIPDEESDDTQEEPEEYLEDDPLAEYNVSKGTTVIDSWMKRLIHSPALDEVMDMIGTEIAKMHLADVIHGDLTTSNMMLRRPDPGAKSRLVRCLSMHVFAVEVDNETRLMCGSKSSSALKTQLRAPSTFCNTNVISL